MDTNKNIFSLTVDYDKTSSPSSAFKAIGEIIESLEKLDSVLVKSVDSKIETDTILENLENGSIKTKLITILKNVDDKGLGELEVKRIIGKFLVKAKYFILKRIETDEELSVEAFKHLPNEIDLIATEAGVRKVGIYTSVTSRELIDRVVGIQESLKYLRSGDKAYFEYDGNKIEVKQREYLSESNLVGIVTRESLSSSSIMFLRVRKPDYLGDTKWIFKHGKTEVKAIITDKDFLNDFHDRKIKVQPGDSIKCEVKVVSKYDFNSDLISAEYEITKVIEVIPPENSTQMKIS